MAAAPVGTMGHRDGIIGRMRAIVPTSAPLVVTLTMSEPERKFFDRLRSKHFPPDRLVVGAHLTLFHALPGERLPELVGYAREVSPDCFALGIGVPRFLGGGVAYPVHADELVALHRSLQQRWKGMLTRQDAQPLRAHVTVQNKVPGAVARRTFDELTAAPHPDRATATGLRFWHYLGGPWDLAAELHFDEGEASLD